ncbi:MAG: SLBB domain-containing protein [Chloracidobacterium sp.]|nr:SLBB domain-containing protein [Chloracidobacterium sp.]
MKLKFLFAVIISLFVFSSINSQDLPPQLSSAKGYLLGPGDEITVKVQGEPDFDFITTVNEDGKFLVLDKILIAKCKTEAELKSEVTRILEKYLKSPQLSLRVTDRKSKPPATVYGEVRTPSQVMLMRKVTLMEVISFSGGPTEDAGGNVRIFRTQPPICTEDYEDSNWKPDTTDPSDVPSKMFTLSNVKLGKDSSNPVIYPGDVILVEKASPVYVTGEVANPQAVLIKEGGLSLFDAISKLGGPKREAKTKDIKVYRRKINSDSPETISANYDLIRTGKQKDIMLEPYDVVVVDKAKDSIGKVLLDLAIGTGKSAISSVTNGIGYRVMY